ncbi:MAG: DNA repair protein RecN [Deltaproteobacteria bacterium]|nr:DNA repair protein RecN [Deltaproteobacteria bacterium]
MLTTLRIQNLAIVDQLEVELAPGLNVVTGETGAGKSILVDAVQLLLGGRAQPDAVRAGASEAVVEGHFAGEGIDARLSALGLPSANDELLVRRAIAKGGRGRVWLNGALSTVGMLGQLGRGLVELSGQHEHVSLMDVGTHLQLLDAFAEAAALLEAHHAAHQSWLLAVRSRDALASDAAERARRADYLAFQVRELEALQPNEGEEAKLAIERRRLSGVEKLRAASEAALELLEGGALEQAQRARAKLAEVVSLDAQLEPVARGLDAGLAELEEASRSLARHVRVLEAQPERLAEVDERLELFRQLARKHGCKPDELPQRLSDARRELDGLVHHEARSASLDAEVVKSRNAAESTAQRLTALRRGSAARFARSVAKELGKLGMPQTRFEVALSAAELGATGMDHVELLMGPNPGEPLLPLARVASGGELSRALLAIRCALAGADPVQTYVFDEVDAGIGGAVASAVGRALQEVSAQRQVLCVTHLPQVAAFADHHLAVRKDVTRGRTVSAVRVLSEPPARQSELARMLGGERVSPAALEHAAQLLQAARREEKGAVRRATRRAARQVRA